MMERGSAILFVIRRICLLKSLGLTGGCVYGKCVADDMLISGALDQSCESYVLFFLLFQISLDRCLFQMNDDCFARVVFICQ